MIIINSLIVFPFKDTDGSSRCVTVASSYGHSKVASYLGERLAQNAETEEEEA